MAVNAGEASEQVDGVEEGVRSHDVDKDFALALQLQEQETSFAGFDGFQSPEHTLHSPHYDVDIAQLTTPTVQAEDDEGKSRASLFTDWLVSFPLSFFGFGGL